MDVWIRKEQLILVYSELSDIYRHTSSEWLQLTQTHVRCHTLSHTFWSAALSCVALCSSVEVSGSPWQQHNGPGLIQSQGRSVGLAGEMQEEESVWVWNPFESGLMCFQLLCWVTEEKTLCLRSTFTSTLDLAFVLLYVRSRSNLFFHHALLLFMHSLFSSLFSDSRSPIISSYLGPALVSARSILSQSSRFSVSLIFSHIQEPCRTSLGALDLVALSLSLPEEGRD